MQCPILYLTLVGVNSIGLISAIVNLDKEMNGYNNNKEISMYYGSKHWEEDNMKKREGMF